jgi:predicted aspartyl protease
LATPRCALLFAFGLMLGLAGHGATAAEPPKINSPRPMPAAAENSQPLPPAVYDKGLEIGGGNVKARDEDTRLSVQVKVNGRGPYRFVVDSGADTSAVSLQMAYDLELPLATPAVLNSTTSRDLVDRVTIAELTLGPTTVRNIHVPALKASDIGSDGLIGIDALVEQRLMMDFEKRLINIEDARVKPARLSPNDIEIVARRQRGQLILTEVRASGVRLDAVIDTGSEISIGNSALRDKLLRKHRGKFYTVEATGVTGVTMKLQMATIPELQLGPVLFRDIPIAFADVPPFRLFGLADEPSLLLGTDLLSNFRRISLDFRARKIRFQLRSCRTEGVAIRTSQTDFFSRLSSTGDVDVCGR